MKTAQQENLQLCHVCHKLAPLEQKYCERCHSRLHSRIPGSISRSWALLITAAILYIPANIMPIMLVSKFDQGQADTIMSGVISLIQMGMVPIAILVFTASIAVPTLKLAGMSYLLLSIQLKWHRSPIQRLKMYRFIEWIGRWSMLDIFVITILVALINMGKLAHIEAGPGALAFGAVVTLTMFSAIVFDPRLLWDNLPPVNDSVNTMDAQ